MPQMTWAEIFNPTFTHGGIDSLTRGTIARIFDDFEGYIDDTALQVVWSVTNGAGGDPIRTTAANAVKGRQSLQITPTGGIGTALRGIPNNTFSYPVGSATGRIRYVVFKMVATSGNQTIRVRLSDASDVNLFKEWEFVVAQEKTRDFVIDLYSGSTTALTGGGFLNTESRPGPAAEGATAWNPALVDRITFRNLTEDITFRIDDIRFFYEYSLLDAIGLGTEPATDDGTDGSLQSKLRYLNNIVLQLIGSTEQYNKYGPAEVRLNNTFTWGLELKGIGEPNIPTTTEITPGDYVIERIRNGITTEIVAATTATEAAGFISASYTPLEDNWQLGDEIVVTFSGGLVDNDTDTPVVPTATIANGATTVQLANAALFQAGQRIRIYDDLNTEFNTVISVDSPTQITINATANEYTLANNFRVVLRIRTDLQTARFSANVNYTPEITAELERWVLADYDDFDATDADGNTERWDTGYIANSDGSAAGAEGGSADINTTTAGQARVSVDPGVIPTQAAYALKRDETFRSAYYSLMVDANVALNGAEATSTFAGLRVSAGDVDDPNNYILIARERSNTVNRITARAEFNGVVQTTVNFSTSDNAAAFKIERYSNVWNIFYSLTQYPNWIWVKLTQFEDANGDMSDITSVYLYAESAGTADAQTAIVDFDNWKYYIGSGSIDQLLSLSYLASGTFTTSSATVPADTGRTEVDNYWNGTLLMPTDGVAAFQPRLIVDFTNAGGVFTIDTDHPFTTAPGVGDRYVILVYQGDLVPAADASNNQTTMAVVGNKSDAIPAMNAVPGTDSIVAHVKAILERVGATPADPDDSVLTNIGQRDDAAIADDLSDVTTTSIQAKLRRLLLRFSSDAFASTIQGVSRTDVENMLSALATYFSSAGAAWAVTANPGGAARDNLEQTLEDFADMLAGTTGIVTFPARAVAANGVSVAEVLRHVSEAVGENSADNVFDSSTVAENGDGSVLERMEEIRGRTVTGTHNIEIADGTTEITVTDISPIRHGRIAIEFDINTLIAVGEGGTVTVRLKNMIDGATLRNIDRFDFVIGGGDDVHPTVAGFVQEGTTTARVSIQVNSAVLAQRAIPYRIIEAS